jgi:tetratricopeptide (TPR) repeat protein
MGVLIGMVLLVLAWPGWLQVAPYQPRGWAVEPNGSLVRMAEQLKDWHGEALLRPDRFSLNLSPEAAHYLAWFCPEEKGFVDSRWPLFDRVADDYVRMHRLLLQEDGSADQELATLLDAHRIDRIILYDAEWGRMARTYRRLFLAPEWELLAVEGSATLFRRKGGTAPSLEAFDYRRAAYHPVRDECVPPPPRPPQPPNWFDVFRRHPDLSSADREEAALHLLSFDLQGRAHAIQWLLVQDMGLIGSRPGLDLAARIHFTPPMAPYPPEPLLLAVRAARRALAVNPDDAHAYLILGESYVRLGRDTRALSWETMLPDLPVLRQTQKLTALEQAVLLRPDLARAHELLARLYYKDGQMDRCLEHQRACLRIAEKIDPNIGPTAELREQLEEVQKLVAKNEKAYQANLTGRTNPSKVLDRAQLASRFGLSHQALEMLQESYPAIYGRPGIEYRLDLMRQSGQSYGILEVLEPEIEFKISRYHWLKACAAAGCGHYAEADTELDKDCEPFRQVGLSANLLVPVRAAMALHIARAILTRSLETEGAAGRVTAMPFQAESMDAVATASGLLRKEAERQVLRGLLALEAGTVETAKQHFRSALSLWDSEAGAQSGAGLDFPARPIAQEALRRMEE